MSRIEELIKEKCPDGVEYKKIGSICKLQNGYAFKSSSFGTGISKVLKITNISNDGKVIVDTMTTVDESAYIQTDFTVYKVKYGDIVVALSGATTGKIGRNLTNETFLLNQRVAKFIPSEKVLNSYLYHYILGKTSLLLKLSGGGAQPNLSTKCIGDIEIPVPPIEVQQEIVRILDKFTELEAELQAELEARKKQRVYLINKSFEFDDSIHMLPLEENADVQRGGSFQKKIFLNKEYRAFIMGNYIHDLDLRQQKLLLI